MNACQQLAITQFGQPSVLAMQTTEIPVPSDSQVLVRVAYAGVNPIDAKTRAGLGWAAQQNKDNLPWVPGYDIAGKVVKVGANVQDFAVGESVAGFVGFPLKGGGYSEYVAVEADALSRVAKGIHLASAAALPLAGQTAWQALDKGQAGENDRVLILAGAGGVGHIAIQLAVARGANVMASCSAANMAFVNDLGATAVDYHRAPLAEQIEPVDVLIDLMGGDVGIAALDCVKPGGRVVTIPTITADAVCEQARQRELQAEGMLVSPSVEQNNAMMAMLESGQLKLHIASQYPLSDGAQAHSDIEAGHTRGKIVLAVDSGE
ncbi:NADP-dependent oxidoreductase [Photobacterium alginatilyticum]|uniref:NADP-dependent oxidoreductase n=1 Tax=Photobacterium alginatilyticum TaxID=1775171 RepID=A0ABW9YKV8_9GAMM|nr:NADP-dependent oxidoreductase [Photobacterium alginatilyticum]NBI54335.1 NADP-dependent oxidoreductase [Photobacterium alginatilyticum]